MLPDRIIATSVGFSELLIVISFGLLVERLKPRNAQPSNSVRLNLAYALVEMLAQTIIMPVFSLATVLAVNAAGGGWIVMSTQGWALLPAFLLYTLTVDFHEYLFHRAQHRLPVLWAMHSLHHSDTALNASTTTRHYWAEQFIKTITIYLSVGMLFKANPLILAIYASLSFYNVFLHMNVRVGFGRWSLVINSPQYHRMHHSSLPYHFDRNFAALFPIFDFIFGTYSRPRDGEYPPTGLDSGECPSGLVEAILWPIRSVWRRSASGTLQR